MFDQGDEAQAFSRRAMLGGTLAAGSLALAPGVALAAKKGNGLPTTAAEQIATVRRMRYRVDAGQFFWWFRGRTYAQQGAKLTPLCGMVFGSLIDMAPLDDGGFEARQYEIGFRTDLVTGERIEKMRNPLTGEMIDIPFAPVGPTPLRYSADNLLDLPKTIGGSSFTYEHVPEIFYRAGDDICLQYEGHSIISTPGQSDRLINEIGTITSPAREALSPHVKCASASIQGTDVTDYARWFKMPPGMGTQTLRSIGRKVTRFADMPADWIAMVEKFDPELVRNPGSVFGRAQATYRN